MKSAAMTATTRARAVRIREPGGPEVLELSTLDVRGPGPGEILVEVAAAGLNRADLLQRRGLYPAPPGVPEDVPGLEYAGVVAAMGPGVRGFREGDRVMGIVSGGSFATHLVVSAREVMPVPSNLSLADAAAIPEVFLTAWDALFLQAKASMGESVLIHAVASGVGSAAVQLCKVAGARPMGTARSQAKLDAVSAYGLDGGVCVRDGRFADAVRALTEGRGADVILDPVGGDYIEEDLRCLAPRGRVVVIGTMGGPTASLPLGALLHQRATVIGTVLRSRAPEEKACLAQSFRRSVLPLFERGMLTPVVEAVLPMRDVRDAHARMEANATAGKLVLTWETAE